jgi:5'-3' exonuclease
MSGTGANKQPILEIDLNMALCGLDISFEQFVDLCILCGCDYCSSIKGIGPKTALKLIRQYKTLEGVVQFVKRDTKKKYQLPKDWTSYRLKPESPEPSPLSADEPANEDGEGTPPASAPVLTEESPVNTEESVGGSEPPAPPVPAPVPACDGAPKDSQDATNEESDDDGLCVSDLDDEAVAEEEEEDIDLVDLLNDEDNEADEDTQTRGTEQKEEEEGELVEPMFKRARELFFNHEVLSATEVELKWLPPQEEELRRFLVERMGFNAERVETGIKKLVEAQGKKAQQRLDR